jgi:hypothetical protein
MPGGEGGGGVFLSYRRQESSHLAGRLSDRLADRFGEDQVFMDVDTIEPGVDFAEEISRAVATCKVLLAIIGPNWLAVTDERGRRRLDDPDDIVRLEIEAALSRDVRVIPILVEGAVMPGRQDLPESLAGLARRNALVIRHESFRSDAGRLVTAIERVLVPAPGAAPVLSVPDTQAIRSAGNVPGGVAQQDIEAVRKDQLRATRVPADALRIAQSITDETWRARALVDVARAMKATDPDRASRLLAEAEHLARSSNTFGDSWVIALTEIASAKAATEPDRAEQLAQSMADYEMDGWVFAAGARAVAATDPDRAEGFIQSVTYSWLKARTLAEVAGAVAATEPDRASRLLAEAEHLAQSIEGDDSKTRTLTDIAGAVAATDPDRASRLLAEAEHLAQSIGEKHWKARTLTDIARAAATDPDRASRLLAEAERLAQSLWDKGQRASGLADVAGAVAATDPDRASRLLAEAERLAQSLWSKYPKAAALANVAKAMASTDPDRAERLAQSITNDELKASALAMIVKDLTAQA